MFAAFEFVVRTAILIAASPLYFLANKTFTEMTEATKSSAQTIVNATVSLATIRAPKKEEPAAPAPKTIRDHLNDAVAYARDKGNAALATVQKNPGTTAAVVVGSIAIIALYYSYPTILSYFQEVASKPELGSPIGPSKSTEIPIKIPTAEKIVESIGGNVNTKELERTGIAPQAVDAAYQVGQKAATTASFAPPAVNHTLSSLSSLISNQTAGMNPAPIEAVVISTPKPDHGYIASKAFANALNETNNNCAEASRIVNEKFGITNLQETVVPSRSQNFSFASNSISPNATAWGESVNATQIAFKSEPGSSTWGAIKFLTEKLFVSIPKAQGTFILDKVNDWTGWDASIVTGFIAYVPEYFGLRYGIPTVLKLANFTFGAEVRADLREDLTQLERALILSKKCTVLLAALGKPIDIDHECEQLANLINVARKRNGMGNISVDEVKAAWEELRGAAEDPPKQPQEQPEA